MWHCSPNELLFREVFGVGKDTPTPGYLDDHDKIDVYC